MAVVTFPVRNKLAYPSGVTAAIDWSHPASSGLLMSAVAVSGGVLPTFRNLITGRPASGTNFLNIGTAIDGAIGPSGLISGGDNPANLGAGPAVSQANQTLACIIVPKNIGTGGVYYGYVLVNNNAGGHSGIYVVGNQLEYFGAGDVFSGLNLANDVPYFIAVSFTANSAAANAAVFVVKNLATGAVQAAQASGNTTSRADNFFFVGGDAATEGSSGRIAAAMYSNRRLSLSQLLAWSNDPWAFWYPNKVANRGSPVAAATFLAAWARGSNLPVIGTGNY